MSFLSTLSNQLRSKKTPAGRILDRGRIFMPFVSFLYLFAIVSYVFVWIVDPYDLRPGGVTVRLSDGSYIDRVVPLIYSVAASDGTDLVLVGGSTSLGYNTKMLKDAFPEARRPINLSFDGPRAEDVQMVLERLERSTSLKRVILNLDWTFFKDVPWPTQARAPRHYTHSWFDPAPEFSPEAVRLSGYVMKTGVLDLPDWHRLNPDVPDPWLAHLPLTDLRPEMDKLEKASKISRGWVIQDALLPCDAFPHLEGMLLPFVKNMAARGVLVDLILPPYSLAVYSDWSINAPFTPIFPQKGGPFANFVSMRRCTVELTSGLANVRVHAFDTDFAITSNLSLYWDSAHLLDQATLREIMSRVAKGDAVLTLAEWPQYERALREAVQKFTP